MKDSNKHIFFKKDYDALLNIIRKLAEDYKKWGKASTEGSSVGDWHDNFAYEESMRQMQMLSKRIVELTSLRDNAEVIDEREVEGGGSKIAIGSKFTLVTDDGQERKYFIGSHTIFRKEQDVDGYRIISYISPLARKLIGKGLDEETTMNIDKKEVTFVIIEIK